MRAIDTNLVVRYLVWDDPVQAPKAAQAIEGGAVYLSTTALLETEWILRSVYRYTKDRRLAALRRLAGLPTLHLQDSRATAIALDWVENGMDFADALHLASAQGCTAFLTFDRRLAQIGRELSGLDVREP